MTQPLREVTKREQVAGQPVGVMWEFLSCGHKLVTDNGCRVAKRRRCFYCRPV